MVKAGYGCKQTAKALGQTKTRQDIDKLLPVSYEERKWTIIPYRKTSVPDPKKKQKKREKSSKHKIFWVTLGGRQRKIGKGRKCWINIGKNGEGKVVIQKKL